MENTCFKILKYAVKHNGKISFECIEKITNIPSKPDQSIWTTNEYVSRLKGYLIDVPTEEMTELGETIYADVLQITVEGRHKVQQTKKENFRFYFPIIVSVLLSFIATFISIMTLYLQIFNHS